LTGLPQILEIHSDALLLQPSPCAAIGKGKLGNARKLYVEAIKKSESSYARTFLLSALLEQRCGEIDKGEFTCCCHTRFSKASNCNNCGYGCVEPEFLQSKNYEIADI